MGDLPYFAPRHESSAEPSGGELSRALDRAEHRRLEQRILADELLEEAARRPTEAGVSIESLEDVPSETAAASKPRGTDPRRPLWLVLAAASVIAPCALTVALSRAAQDAAVSAPPVAALPNRAADPAEDLPKPPPLEALPPVPTASAEAEPASPPAEPKPRPAARPRPSATSDVAPGGDKPFFDKKR